MIGRRLKQLRDSWGRTQEEVAEAVGVSTRQIVRWESDENDPTGDMIVKVAELFQVTSDYLLGLTDDPTGRLAEEDLSPMERKLVAAIRSGQIVEALEVFTILSKHPDETEVAPPEPAVNR